MASKQPAILDAIESATADDLVAIDAQLVELDRRRESLVAARKIIDAKLHGKPQRQPRVDGGAGGRVDRRSDDEMRSEIHDLLTTHKVPMKPAMIGQRLGIAPTKVGRLVNHEWFVRGVEGIEIA
jgi:hypothetical protein